MHTVVSLFYKGHAFLNDVMSEDQEKNTTYLGIVSELWLSNTCRATFIYLKDNPTLFQGYFHMTTS